MDIATWNNTVAILVISNPHPQPTWRKRTAYPKRKTASLLDTFSCVFQGITPYGAQMLVAISAYGARFRGVGVQIIRFCSAVPAADQLARVHLLVPGKEPASATTS